MRRRAFLGAMATLACSGAVPDGLRAQEASDLLSGPLNPLAGAWSAWKSAFLAEDGRVIDTLQDGVSHSESQGYGLLLAVMFGDTMAFDRIYRWTEANLAIRSDALLAWRWMPSGQVPDRNNASDGDLFYAWALVLRGQQGGNPEFLERAGAIARDLVRTCVVPSPQAQGGLLFTPAAEGFDRDGRMIVNPSYYMPRAMREVAQATGASALADCARDGEAMMADLSVTGLIPDWIAIGPDGPREAVGMSARNGYEAMRVAPFLVWSGSASHPAVARQAEAYRRARGNLSPGRFVTVFERISGAAVETSTHRGYGAVAAVVDCAESPTQGAPIPPFRADDQAYYPATLHLMALIAQISAAPECVPI